MRDSGEQRGLAPRAMCALAIAMACLAISLAAGCSVGKQGMAPRDSSDRLSSLDEQEAAVDPNDLEELERLLSAAESTFGAELRAAEQAARPGEAQRWATAPPNAGPAAAAPAQQGVGEEPRPAPSPAMAPGPAGDDHAESEPARKAAAESERPGACEAACRALGSMQRAAAGICRITGEGHERCALALARVDDASERLRRVGCGCDGDDR